MSLLKKKEEMMARKDRREEYLARMERERLDLERERFRASEGRSPTTAREERYIIL